MEQRAGKRENQNHTSHPGNNTSPTVDFLRICSRYSTEREIKAGPKIESVFNVET